MNKDLLTFIDLCLIDGAISEKERKVIFAKAKELGVGKDECEVLIESLTQKKNKTTTKPTIKKREFEKQYLSKKSQPIYIYTTDDYSKETLDVVLEKFKPYGVKPQMTTSSAKADFIWSCKISTGRASSSYTSYRGSCNFNGEVKLVEEFELSGLAHNDKIDDYIILKINQNLRINSAH